MFWFIFIPFAWKNNLHNVQKYELLRNYLPASRFFMVHKGSHTHCAGIKTPPPSPQCAPAAHSPARRAEITFVKTRRKPHWRKTKKQGRKSKICPTYFKISQTYFCPPRTPMVFNGLRWPYFRTGINIRPPHNARNGNQARRRQKAAPKQRRRPAQHRPPELFQTLRGFFTSTQT